MADLNEIIYNYINKIPLIVQDSNGLYIVPNGDIVPYDSEDRTQGLLLYSNTNYHIPGTYSNRYRYDQETEKWYLEE